MFIIKRKNSSFYQLVYKVNGKRKFVSTKTSNYQEAKSFLKNFDQSSKPKVASHTSVTLQQFCDEYVANASVTKSKYYLRSIKMSFKLLLDFTKDIPLTSLDYRTLDRFFTATYARTPKGVSHYYRTLKAAFSKAVLWEYLTENPIKKIKLAKQQKSYPAFITFTELKNIVNKTNEPFLKELFITAFFTGMRLGELVNMNWSWIDFSKSQINIKLSSSFTTKSKKERYIPMNKYLKKLLLLKKAKTTNGNNYTFINNKGLRLNEDFVSKKFKDAVRSAALSDDIHFHTLRHSFASNLVQKGVSLYVVKELLGHEELSTPQIYSHLQKQNLRGAVNLL